MVIGLPSGKEDMINLISVRKESMSYYRNPKNKGKKVEKARHNHDPEHKEYRLKVSFAGVDKCVDNWDDISRVGSGWGQPHSWKDSTKRKHQWK